jgi:membrane protease subunit HflK
LNNLFKGKGQGGGSNQPPSSKGTGGDGMKSSIGAGVVVLIAVVVWVFSGFFMIQEGQTGVVLHFGKYSHTTRPGINWRMPWPVQSHEVVNLSSIRSVEVGRANLIKASNLKDSSMLTEDENIIDVKFAVQYRLKDASEYLFNNKDPDAAVVQSAETAVREIVGKSKMDNVLYENREKLAIDLNASIQKILDSYKAGIFITSVTVQNVQPPEQVQAAFDDAVKAGQDRERLKNEGQAYANDIIPKARGAADRLMQEAEGYKAKVSATAEGDATRFKLIQVEYAKAPQVTRERMYIDAMQEIYNNVTKVMVDQRSSNGSLLYLPLDKLIQQVGPNTVPLPLQTSNTMANTPANTSSPNPNSPIVNPAAVPAERRDTSGLRSRER